MLTAINTIKGYGRCSTNETMQDVDRQKRELMKLGIKEEDIYLEYGSSVDTDRVQFNKLLANVRPGDTIAATEVSRFTRSTQQLCEFVEIIKSRKLKLIIGTFIVDCRHDEIDPMTDGMLKMMGVFAEMERNMIRQRVRSGMENARAKGKTIGRPIMTIDGLPDLFIRHYPKYASKQVTQIELARLCNTTRQTVAKYIKMYKQSVVNQ